MSAERVFVAYHGLWEGWGELLETYEGLPFAPDLVGETCYVVKLDEAPPNWVDSTGVFIKSEIVDKAVSLPPPWSMLPAPLEQYSATAWDE